jgi:hypothetical protein
MDLPSRTKPSKKNEIKTSSPLSIFPGHRTDRVMSSFCTLLWEDEGALLWEDEGQVKLGHENPNLPCSGEIVECSILSRIIG